MIFLIEYAENCFINGYEIKHLFANGERVEFCLRGDSSGSIYVVDKSKVEMFLYHLNILNKSGINLEKQNETIQRTFADD